MSRGLLAATILAAAILTAGALAAAASAQDLAAPDGPAFSPLDVTAAQRLLLESESQIRWRFERGRTALEFADRRLHAPQELARFYEERFYHPAWFDSLGPRDAARELLQAVLEAEHHGLHPPDYHLEVLRECLERNGLPSAPLLVECELLLSDAYFLLASHLMSGRLDPVRIDPTWYSPPEGTDLVRLLREALAANRIAVGLAELAPRQEQYRRLRIELLRHRDIVAAGGWPEVPGGPTLRPGEWSPRVPALRARLAATGELPPPAGLEGEDAAPADPLLYDPELETAVRTFQARCGLDPDGVIGPRTLAQLNTTARRRLLQIAANLERWRWLPQDLGEMHVLVNVAAYELTAVRDRDAVLRMPVVVGKDYLETPSFSDRITYLVLNPSWEIPPGIIEREILPAVRRDVGYLPERGIEVLRGWGKDEQAVDPHEIDWRRLAARRSPYRFRQAPGPTNPLGRIKFMFPNQFAVYLHDSPARGLFGRHSRAFSSGCVRVASALELADFLLSGSRWDRKALREAIDTGREQVVSLPKPVPVHLVYWTAWIEEDGSLRFTEDIYDRDRPVLRALRHTPPAPRSGRPVASSRSTAGVRR